MLLVKNAKLVIGEDFSEENGKYSDIFVIRDILIKDGIIIEIEDEIKEENIIVHSHEYKVYDAQYNLVIPGLIDPHTHMRDPGLTHKEDFVTGSMAAARGGVTTFLDMPNTNPPTVTYENLILKRENSHNRSYVDYGFHFGGSRIDNSSEIKKAVSSVASTKIFLNMSTGDMLVEDFTTLENLFKESNIVSVHAEEDKVALALELAEKFNKPLYLCHLSTKEEVKLLKEAKERGVEVYGEVTPHHLFLNTENYLDGMNDKLLRMRPELKSKEDNIALLQALSEGIIDTVGTDHAPHLLEEKLARTTYGIPGVEHSLEIMLKAYQSGNITLFRLVSAMSSKVAEIFGIKNKGELTTGFHGDFVVVNLHDVYTINNNHVISKCGWTPWNEFHTGGKVIATFLRGQKVYEEGKFYEGFGEEIEYGN